MVTITPQMESAIMTTPRLTDFERRYDLHGDKLREILREKYGTTSYIKARKIAIDCFIIKNHETFTIPELAKHTDLSHPQIINRIRKLTGKKIYSISEATATHATINMRIAKIKDKFQQRTIKFREYWLISGKKISSPSKAKLVWHKKYVMLQQNKMKIAKLEYFDVDPLTLNDRIKEFVIRYSTMDNVAMAILNKRR